MALIAMACYDTVENKRSEMTKKTLQYSLRWLRRHRLFIVDNGSCQETKDIIHEHKDWMVRNEGPADITIITNETNLGTAAAINQAWKHRNPGEHCVKIDNDVWIHKGPFCKKWPDELETAINRDPTIGICCLKRKDLEERPDHENMWFKSELKMLPHKPGERWIVVEKVLHCMGTVQMYNSALLDKIGFLYQPFIYGFDDSLAAARAEIAGFYSCFLPHIDIDHLDHGGTDYTKWKSDVAGQYMQQFSDIRDEYYSGKRSIYYDGN